jgi:hypothetical protein
MHFNLTQYHDRRSSETTEFHQFYQPESQHQAPATIQHDVNMHPVMDYAGLSSSSYEETKTEWMILTMTLMLDIKGSRNN